MKLSIITSSYNSAATIRDTLESVAMQDYHDIEHIIIDGGSTDGTLEIVREFEHVVKIISEDDHGIYDAMNKGILHATGDIVGILNSDDFYINPDVVSRIVELFREHKSDSLYGDLEYVDMNDINKIKRKWKSKDYQKSKFLYGWMPPHPTFFVKKEIYEKHGNFNLQLKSSADYELMLRFLYKHHISTVYLPEVIVRMRSGGHSNASLLNRFRANREDVQAWKINGLKPYFFTLFLKPARKLIQYL